MKEINEEIKLTLNLMQTDIHEVSINELQYHLNGLLGMKRNELQRRLVERSWLEPVTQDQAPYKSVKLDGQVADEDKPITTEELKSGGWWCADVSADCANAFKSKHLRVFNSSVWGVGPFKGCEIDEIHGVSGEWHDNKWNKKQIHRIGNEFYWSEK